MFIDITQMEAKMEAANLYKKNTRVLVGFTHNWADEFDVHGIAVLTLEQYEQTLAWAKNATFNFGTNEGWEEEDISEGYFVITYEEYTIQMYLSTLPFNTFDGFPSWGTFPAYEPAWDGED